MLWCWYRHWGFRIAGKEVRNAQAVFPIARHWEQEKSQHMQCIHPVVYRLEWLAGPLSARVWACLDSTFSTGGKMAEGRPATAFFGKKGDGDFM